MKGSRQSVVGGNRFSAARNGAGRAFRVGLPRTAVYLLRTLDPDRHPVVVMGDRADLKA